MYKYCKRLPTGLAILAWGDGINFQGISTRLRESRGLIFACNQGFFVPLQTDMYNKKIPVDTKCGFRVAIEVMGGKWKPYLIYELLEGARRPSELQRRLPEASDRVIAQQLKELVEYGVVEKRVVDSVCKHSEYSLSPLGKTLIPIIDKLREWGDGFRLQMEELIKNKK